MKCLIFQSIKHLWFSQGGQSASGLVSCSRAPFRRKLNPFWDSQEQDCSKTTDSSFYTKNCTDCTPIHYAQLILLFNGDFLVLLHFCSLSCNDLCFFSVLFILFLYFRFILGVISFSQILYVPQFSFSISLLFSPVHQLYSIYFIFTHLHYRGALLV